MNKGKTIIISISIVLVIIILVFGSTYAYLTAMTNEEPINEASGMLGINYTAPGNITGELISSTDRESGLHSVATASLKSGSEKALLNMYITPITLTDNLKITAFKWEVVVGTTVIKSGDFTGRTVNTPIKIVDGYTLSTTATTFNIYIWLDADLLTEGLSEASFAAKISADSVPITGGF